MIYRFDRFELDAERETLTGPDGPVALRDHALLVLKLLVERAPEVVSRDEILDGVWGHQALSESSIAQVIREIRSALGDSARSPRHVATRYGRGYQFVADVEIAEAPRVQAAPVRRIGPAMAGLLLLAVIAAGVFHWFGGPPVPDDGQDRVVLRALQAGTGDSLSAPFVDYLAFILSRSLGSDRVDVADAEDGDAVGIGVGLASLPEGEEGRLAFWLENGGAGSDPASRQRFEEAGELVRAGLEQVLATIEYDGKVALEAGLVSRSGYAIETVLRGMAAQFAGEMDRAIRLFEAALAEDPDFDFARYELAIALRRSGEYARAQAVLEAMATRLEDDFWVARIYNALGLAYWRQSEYEKALAAYERVEAVADTPALRAISLTNMGLLLRNRGDLERAERLFRQALAQSELSGQSPLIASACNSLASILMRTGRQEEALEQLDRARELFYEAGRRSSYASVMSRTAAAHEQLGRLDEARSLLRLVVGVREQLGDARGAAASRIRLSRLERQAGDFEEARVLAVEGLDELLSTSDDGLILDAYSALAALALADRRFDDARTYGREARRIADRAGLEDRVVDIELDLMEVDIEAGVTSEDSSQKMSTLLASAEKTASAPRVVQARLLGARLARQAGEYEDARRDLEVALEAADGRDDRLFLRPELGLVELELTQGRPDAALDRVVRLERADPPAHPFLALKARALAANGRYREAVETSLEARSTTGEWWRAEDQARLDNWTAAQER